MTKPAVLGEAHEAPSEPVDLGDGPRVLGTDQGQFTVPDDFDEPLPTEIEDDFYT